MVLVVSSFVLFLSLLARLGGIFRAGCEVSLGGDVSVRFASFFDVF